MPKLKDLPPALKLSFAQTRILKCLRNARNGLTRLQIAEIANVRSGITEPLGPIHAEDYPIHKNSLLSLRYVVCSADSLNGTPAYVITRSGLKALEEQNSDVRWPFGH